MSNLVDHARNELQKIGQFKEDPMFAQSLLAAVAAFASYGHSGGSVEAGIHMLEQVLRFKNLSPLTNDPAEWILHTPEMWDGENHIWQNARNSAAFSPDGGLTYWLLEDIGTPKEHELYRSLITHDDNGEEIGEKAPDEFLTAVAESPGVAEPSDFYGGATDVEADRG